MDKTVKILVADDSAFMRNVLKNILNGIGLTDITEAENGKIALEKFNEINPGLVLLDLIMPEMGGIEVLKSIGTKGNFIVVSAVGQDNVIAEAKALGAKGYIIKPFDIAQVVAEVTRVIG